MEAVQTKNIKQGLMIKASAHAIYMALMDSKQHAKFTGQPAKISPKVGGAFTLLNLMGIFGKMPIKLHEGKVVFLV